ncbi:hypothetical protein [Fodinicola feengrottensis]|uniref:hypothetical protein n=1 Tax=Fodinicola feengrottensis TaxID=435914 RepID=UPI002442EE41|nr:hypothetical protein [Fodinicola feengrottensis]
MTIALSVAVVILGALLFVLLGSQVEMYRDIAQLRDLSGLIDRPLKVDVSAAVGARPSAYGLPAALDTVDAGLVLFLSDKCATCRTIATSLGSQFPADLWVVLDPANPRKDSEIKVNYPLEQEKVTVDHSREISASVGVTLTPPRSSCWTAGSSESRHRALHPAAHRNAAHAARRPDCRSTTWSRTSVGFRGIEEGPPMTEQTITKTIESPAKVVRENARGAGGTGHARRRRNGPGRRARGRTGDRRAGRRRLPGLAVLPPRQM